MYLAGASYYKLSNYVCDGGVLLMFTATVYTCVLVTLAYKTQGCSGCHFVGTSGATPTVIATLNNL